MKTITDWTDDAHAITFLGRTYDEQSITCPKSKVQGIHIHPVNGEFWTFDVLVEGYGTFNGQWYTSREEAESKRTILATALGWYS